MTKDAPDPVQKTILVVEDDVLMRMSLCDYLRKCGYRVVEAATVGEAMKLMDDLKAFIDIVFSAVDFGGRTEGFQFARWVRQHHPSAQVVLAGSLKRAVMNAEELCEESHVPKPYHAQDVLRRIRRLLASRNNNVPEPTGAESQEQP